jgi:hypothetical protein
LAEAAAQGYTEQWWPQPYRSAKSQLERAAERSAAERAAVSTITTAAESSAASKDNL